MKRFLYIIIGIAILFTSCDKEESDNGNLDGFWQMTLMSSKIDNSKSDMRSSGITWSFQGHILELRDVKKSHQDIVMSFVSEDNKLSLSAPYRVDRDSDDAALKDADMLIPYGISDTTETFSISELTSNRMVLDNAVMHLEFRKY